MTRTLGRRLAGLLAALLCCAAALAAGSPRAGLAAAARPASAAGLASQSVPVARPGTNLLVNPGAQTGAVSARGWDSVTTPGWGVSSGLPTVVGYGTKHFPRATGRWPALPGGQMFAGGAGGTARLRQLVPLRSAAGLPVAAGTRYRLSAWLGGTAWSRASATVAFMSAAGRVLARRAIGPAGRASATGGLARRAATGTLPPGTASARVTVVLATSVTNIDGWNSPYTGYNRAVGGDSGTVTPITAATGRAGPGIPVGYSPAAIAISRSGRTAYVVNTISGTVTPVDTTDRRAGRPVRVGIYAYPTAITLAPSGTTSVVVNTYAGRVTLINTHTRRVVAQITVGVYPTAAAITG